MGATRRFLGIFVHPVDVQSAGLDRVFDDLDRIGTTAVCLTPKVARPAQEGSGVRFPPLHVDGHARVLDRPLWGHRELALEFSAARAARSGLFEGTTYKPRGQFVPSGVEASVPSRMIAEAKERGWEAHMLIQPFLPPMLRPEDVPVRIDGSRHTGPRVAPTACLNSPAARSYALALARDTAQQYPEIDGLFLDWAEYGSYRLEDCFSCFCPRCEEVALKEGTDWSRVRADMARAWDLLHKLRPTAVPLVRTRSGRVRALLREVAGLPGWKELEAHKARTVVGFYQEVRRQLDAQGSAAVRLSARGWPPPWNRTSGMDYAGLAGICPAVTPKLFTFDYSALPRWYAEALLAWNPSIGESEALDALIEWMDLEDDLCPRRLDHYGILAPGATNPIKLSIYRRRIAETCEAVAGRARVLPFAHAYLTEPQWQEKIALVRDSPADGMWIQMYGYLSDRKMDILHGTWR